MRDREVMIRDLSLTLQAVLDDATLAGDFPELLAAQVSFDRPSEGFSPGVPTVDLFLFDVRENMELRSNEPQKTRTNGDIAIQRPPLRVACSYLLTAWPVGGADLALQEHRLLSQALEVLSRYPQIPDAFVKGSLVGQEPPLPMVTARTEGLKEPYEFWAAIGNKMRASLVVTATIGMDVCPAVSAHQVSSSMTRLGLRASALGEGLIPGPGQEIFRIGGRVREAGGAPVPGANVTLPELGLAARTDAEGRYLLGAMAAGTYALRVQKDATVKNLSVAVPPASSGQYDVQL